MFETRRPRNRVGSAFQMLELIFHWTARELSQSHRHPAMALLKQIFQTLLMISVFYVMFNVMGMRKSAVRGDYMLYLMSGVFCFMVHVKAVSAVQKADGPTSPMVLHAPMNTMISIISVALTDLYRQVVAAAVILGVYEAFTGNVVLDQPVPAVGMFILCWASGCAVGILLWGLKPFLPALTGMAITIYMRANMVFSGKMFVANSLPGFMMPFFDWNPLFHIIDQLRGFVFLNYNPHFTSVSYPIYLSLAFVALGLLFQFYAGERAKGHPI
ncbi:MAG: ABC transporter permease [Rhodobacterales bacterium]|nr:MAG: ABC transporter permease [Rhodobacterales bacterium]